MSWTNFTTEPTYVDLPLCKIFTSDLPGWKVITVIFLLLSGHNQEVLNAFNNFILINFTWWYLQES